jgi:Flp pilus assembly protein CpaB
VTNTVLQDVEILTTGQKIEPDPEGKPTTATVAGQSTMRRFSALIC